jgi:hypothetical protein
VKQKFLKRDLLIRQRNDHVDDGREIACNLIEHGFHIFRDSLPSFKAFQPLYDSFDRLSEVVLSNPKIISEWEGAVALWQAEDDNSAFYCRVPPIFRDRKGRAEKRDKAYLQFCLDFAASTAYQNSSLSRINEVCALFAHLEELHFICVDLFSKAISSICKNEKITKRKLQHPNRLSPIVFKLVRYNPRPKRFGTDPHYDKSALSDDLPLWK